MAVYKPYRKTASGKEEIKIPYSSIDGTPTIPDISGKANLSGGNTFTGKQTLNSPSSDGYSINAAGYVKGSWLQASAISNKGANTGKVCVFDDSGWVYYRTPAEILTEAGGATTDQIPTVNNGTLTIQKNGEKVQTFSANQSSSVTANIIVPTKASDVNALSLDGGTINKSKTVKMDASANSDGANLKWGTVNSKNPYIGYASDQSDGTFVVSSLLGTNYASGLAIGGGSGNLLWKGTKVATTSDIPTVNNGTLTIQKNGTTVQTFSANQSGNVTANITFHLYEHNIYLSCSKGTSTSAPSRAYVYFTVITTSATAWNWNTLISPNYFAGKSITINAGGYGYIADPEGNNRSYNGSVQTIFFGSSYIVVEMVYNNSLLVIDNEHSGAFFYSSDVTITDKVRTIL